jgi:hypothetical protein
MEAVVATIPTGKKIVFNNPPVVTKVDCRFSSKKTC